MTMPIEEAAKRRQYTTKELAFIRQNYREKGAQYVARELRRTARSIYRTAWKHGVCGKRGRRADV